MLLDTLPEPEFDRVTALAAKVFEVPIALVSLVDADRQWFKSCVGIAGSETDRDVAFCAYAIVRKDTMVVPDAALDPRFVDNPFVTGEPHVRFYAGAPLVTSQGHALGTLCIVDTKPRELSAAQVAMLESLAAIVVDLVEARLGFRAREMFEQVAELSPNVIYLFDLPSRSNVYGNRAMTELLGYPASSVGSALTERMLHPSDQAGCAAHLARMAKLPDGEVVELTFRVLSADGTYRIVTARETVFERAPDGSVTKTLGVATDITDLKRAENKAVRHAATLAAVLSSAGEGIVAADAHGKVTMVNAAAEAILGTSDQIHDPEARDNHYGVFELDGVTRIAPDDLPLARAIRAEVTNSREVIVRARSKPTRYLIATGRPLPCGDDGGSKGAVVTFSDVTALKKAQLALADLAVTDELTKLPNKRALRERLAILAREGRRGRKFATVVVDVDHFKAVNDTHGHPVGDAVLQHVGQVLREKIRSTDFVARFGGEEFVVLYTDVDESVAATLAEHLREAVATCESPVRITASFGVCSNLGELAGDGDAMIARADEALYRAKRAGRNRVVAHHTTMTSTARGVTQRVPIVARG